MTFDEAIEHFRNNTDISGTAVFLDDVEDALKELREEYAPTVELTKDQYEVLGDLDIEVITQIMLHPENIKVVDE